MKKVLSTIRFPRISLRDLAMTVGPALLLLVAVCVAGFWLADPLPPEMVVMATGEENSAFDKLGKWYVDELASHHIHLVLKSTLGSQENLRLIGDPESEVEIGFVRSGSITRKEAEKNGLISLGSLFYEPLWIFYRSEKEINSLSGLRGRTINIGSSGDGVGDLFRQLLDANHIAEKEMKLTTQQEAPATQALLDGKIDALVLTSTSESPLIQKLLQTPDIRLFDFPQAEAYTRRFPFLSHVVLPRGIVDLGRDIPARDYHLLAPTATLMAHEDIHPALIDLFVKAAYDIHGGPGWFRRQGDFPSSQYTEIPVAREATRYYKNGPPFLQRYLDFSFANFIERMWVVLVAFGALLIPLSRIVPPLYVWRIRSRIYRWYGQLRAIELGIEEVTSKQEPHGYTQQLHRLSELEQKVNQITVPLSFAEQLYELRSHIHLVRQRLLGFIK